MAEQLGELALRVGGKLTGDAQLSITGAATLDEAVAGQITLVDHADKARRLADTAAAAAIVPRGVSAAGKPTIEVDDPHQAFITLLQLFRPARSSRRVGISRQANIDSSAHIDATAEIHPGASIGADVEIGPRTIIHSGACVMDGCRIAADVIVFPNAVLYPETIVGPRVVLHAGVIVGGHGFGYAQVAGRHEPAAQLGHVRIESDVEIGPNSTVDRGTYGATVIGEGTKIDNQVQIAHNCRIGRHNLICAQVGIAGSTSTGDYVVIAGQVGVRDHVHIGDRAIISAMAGITNHVPAGAIMMGIPATPIRDQKVLQATLSKLPEMRKDLKALSRRVEQLVGQASTAMPPEWLDESATTEPDRSARNHAA
ncbi:MAG: UDP-3-O-(3-hydroxymyristoyl)glucosamine N-acyltransferase [Pirellulales bacterium]|nr:UDP-3-O-(3-hydroxymyristoyl)glucosamine N-acyltransferase [Pirellulales bacterium]